MAHASTKILYALGLLLIPALALESGCAFTQKKIAQRMTYRAGYVASSDGKNFYSLLELLNRAELAKPSCRAVNRNIQTKAQYLVERRDGSITVKVKECESVASGNCQKLEKCLLARPVAWIARASGRNSELAGTIYTDWLGRCGGSIAVNFYYGPQNPLPIERIGCSEPLHDRIDTAYEMFLVSRPSYENGPMVVDQTPAANPYIEALLKKWDEISFSAVDGVLPPIN
ncbi:MAG: hypothetical protein HY074_12670 [Deltaproteobacteria bacterium]|nr:hypothetical protein [Deltaproteobacteria bacterium]